MYIVDDKVYEKVTSDLFTVFKEVEVPTIENITPEFHGKPIPMSMWHDIMHCMKQTQDKFKSEALIFLFYDTTAKQPWSWWLPPQQTNGMTVKSLPNDPAYKAQRTNYPDLMLGTVHHHCTASAFQSSTDESDEINREGMHFTIGHLDKDVFDLHFRMSLGGQCVDLDPHTYIEKVASPFKKNITVADNIRDAVINRMTQDEMLNYNPNRSEDYSSFFDNIHQPTFTTTKYTKPYTAKPHKGLGWDDRPDWWENQYYNQPTKSKKNSHEEAAEELRDMFMTDYEYEDCLINYYSYLNNSSSCQRLVTSNVDEEQLTKDILEMLEDERYQATTDGKEMLKLIETFCSEQRQFGVDTTIAELQHGLSTLDIEDRSTVQHVDQEQLS
jgi:hypothetical protein